MIAGVSFASFVGDRDVGPVGKDKTWFACCTVSVNMSCDKFGLCALRLTMKCGVVGVTALHGVGINLRCEFGVVMCVSVGCITLRGVAPFTTLQGETAICTLGVASLSFISNRGEGASFCRAGSC
jgi:hypothetical protein